jgi:transcriptional regulator with XRE-family HTH domain
MKCSVSGVHRSKDGRTRRPTLARDVLKNKKSTIGETIKHFRQEKLWTQAELAGRLETTTTSIGRWENNVTRPSLHFQQQLCHLFGKSPEEFGFLPEMESEQEPRPDEALEEKRQDQETEPGQREITRLSEATESSALFQPPVSFPPLKPALLPRKSVLWQRRSLLFVMAGLSILLLLSSVFWFARQHTLSSSAHRPSCQTPSAYESATAIYAQVMCTHALLSSTLDRQDALQWDENNQCLFTHGAYHVLLPSTTYVAECFAHAAPFLQNFALQVAITVLKGDSGGLVFRAKRPSPNWDVITSRLPIDIWGQYNFYLASANVPCHLSKDASNPNYCHSPLGTITYGLDVTNTITVIIFGSQVYFYANGIFIDQAEAPASSPSTGFLGVFATGIQATADVAFSQFRIWNI